MYLANNTIYYACFNPPEADGFEQINKIFVARTKKGICLIEFSGVEEKSFGLTLKKNLETRFKKKTIQDNTAINDVRDALTGYFAGKTTVFHIPVDLSIGTQFQQRVWRKLKDIPYGKVKTYKWVAEGIGLPKGVRAIGQACGSNPVPIIIPCHRVIRTGGGLGGFSSGIAIKKQLLRLEGVSLRAEGEAIS